MQISVREFGQASRTKAFRELYQIGDSLGKRQSGLNEYVIFISLFFGEIFPTRVN